MPVDSFKYLPRSLRGYYESRRPVRREPVPWKPLEKPLAQAKVALVTTAGIYVQGLEPPFDAEREKREPMWGDPTFRRIPRETRQEQIGACHLHINNRDILVDVNIQLPLQRFLELEAAGRIGTLAETNYSFMGYQPNTTEWEEKYGPECAGLMKDEAVDAVLLTPA
jgi:D-proline reductase (dithiol) PrdB